MEKFKIAVCTENYNIVNKVKESVKSLTEDFEVEVFEHYTNVQNSKDFSIIIVEYLELEDFTDVDNLNNFGVNIILIHRYTLDTLERIIAVKFLYEKYNFISLLYPISTYDIMYAMFCFSDYHNSKSLFSDFAKNKTVINPLLVKALRDLKKETYDRGLDHLFSIGCRFYCVVGSEEELLKFQETLEPAKAQSSHIQDKTLLLMIPPYEIEHMKAFQKEFPNLIFDLRLEEDFLDYWRYQEQMVEDDDEEYEDEETEDVES